MQKQSRYSAIFDNTVFNISARLLSIDLVQIAATLFDKIVVPSHILTEIQRFPTGCEPFVAQKMECYARQVGELFELCTTYDNITLAFIQTMPNVDLGEAEAIAQANKRNIRFFFTDDERCIHALKGKFSNIYFVSTLYLIALLDIHKYIHDYPTLIKEYNQYKSLKNKKHKKLFRDEYWRACSDLGIPISKKELSQKTSLKKLGVI